MEGGWGFCMLKRERGGKEQDCWAVVDAVLLVLVDVAPCPRAFAHDDPMYPGLLQQHGQSSGSDDRRGGQSESSGESGLARTASMRSFDSSRPSSLAGASKRSCTETSLGSSPDGAAFAEYLRSMAAAIDTQAVPAGDGTLSALGELVSLIASPPPPPSGPTPVPPHFFSATALSMGPPSATAGTALGTLPALAFAQPTD
eukprot:SM001859S04165  [mRNA]  locus=s1859:458:1959:+ [translate_table: standard]